MFSTFLAAIAGAATDNGMLPPTAHHLLAIAMFGVNALAAVIEYAAIRGNGKLIDGILARVAGLDTTASEPAGIPPDHPLIDTSRQTGCL
jgi:hypothetical protein